MTSFIDGPAKGQHLQLHRKCRFLRVTQEGDKFDALDAIDDEPRPTERLIAYEMHEDLGMAHLNMGRKGSGFYAMANYKLVPDQPADADMRTRAAWVAWCEKKAGAV